MTERRLWRLPGLLVLPFVLGLGTVGFLVAAGGVGTEASSVPGINDEIVVSGGRLAAGVALVVLALIALAGFSLLEPGEAKAATLLGNYVGTLREDGFWWVVPITGREFVSLRIRNFDSDVIKVNDANGNPIEIAAVVTWRVDDTAKALFDVEDFEEFVQLQSEAAIRHVATSYPYDDYEAADGEARVTLMGNAEVVTASLLAELQEGLRRVGVEVLGSRLQRLAYSPEIAGEMLRRQQASAVVAARRLIAEGAIGIVDDTIKGLQAKGIVTLGDTERATLATALMVAMVSDRGVQPVLSTGA